MLQNAHHQLTTWLSPQGDRLLLNHQTILLAAWAPSTISTYRHGINHLLRIATSPTLLSTERPSTTQPSRPSFKRDTPKASLKRPFPPPNFCSTSNLSRNHKSKRTGCTPKLHYASTIPPRRKFGRLRPGLQPLPVHARIYRTTPSSLWQFYPLLWAFEPRRQQTSLSNILHKYQRRAACPFTPPNDHRELHLPSVPCKTTHTVGPFISCRCCVSRTLTGHTVRFFPTPPLSTNNFTNSYQKTP